jgi:hypothetical protein
MFRGDGPMKEETTMRTSILAVVLTAVAPVMAHAQSPTWQTDYAAAFQKASTRQMPLAVIFGAGADGWKQLGGGSLPSDATRILVEKYVPCYIDTTTAVGNALARRFELKGSVGIVLSDHGGSIQAFWHEGPLSADTLAGYLNKYADPSRVATTTETNPGSRGQVSNYPPTAGAAATPYVPAYYTPGFAAPAYPAPAAYGGVPSSFGSGNCPT